MGLNPRLELRTQQRLALTPDLRLRLDLLRMGPAELAEEIAREAARNPFLLYEPPSLATGGVAADPALMAPAAPFQDDLRRQIARRDLPPRIAAIAGLLIGELRPDGFLDTDLDALAEVHDLDPEALDEALAALQGCEPAGIGARSVGECLALQLADHGLTRAEAEATLRLLPQFARMDWKRIGAALGLDAAGVRARAMLLRGLSPRPVIDSADPAASALVPDLRLVRLPGGGLSVEPVETARPLARLDAAMCRKAETEGFAPELLSRARALIAALQQRGQTLARIGRWLAEMQAAFFQQGVAALVPATRQDLAQALGLHPSTISRALSGKAIDVDGRLWPLGVFFSTALPARDGAVSARAVQQRIAELIAAEPATRPLSDESLAGMLHVEGVDIARRTVAKYRQGLRIPPSSTRRRLSASRRRE